MRSRETQSDMHSVVGHLVFQGRLHDLKRMESLGIPCDHIVALLVYLDFMEIPTSLVLGRWSKNTWSKVRQYVKKGLFCWDSMVSCRNWMLNDLRREMCVLASVREDQFTTVTEKVRSEINQLKYDTEAGPSSTVVVSQSSTLEGCVQDPLVVRRKKRPKKDSVNRTLVRGVRRCSVCRWVGHNQTSCQSNRRQGQRKQPSHEEGVDEDNYHTPNFGEEVDDEYPHYHSEPVGQEEHFSLDEEEFQVPLTDPYYSWHE
ncbi:hypothetical protein HN51_003264 [Arachis hypogaea]